MTSDKYATAEAYYGLARAYSNVPDLHIMWLLYLCEVHQGNQSYAEAAQCAVAVAGVIMQVHIALCSTVQHLILHRLSRNLSGCLVCNLYGVWKPPSQILD